MHYMRVSALLTGIALLFPVAACEVTSEKIQRWKGTQKGPDKLRAAVRDDGLALPLRVEAARALVDINRAQPLVAELESLAAGTRARIGDALATQLVTGMEEGGESTSRVQLQLKDALFSLRSTLSEGRRSKVDTALIAWLLVDWEARSGGEHSGPKIVRAIGKVAGDPLATSVAASPALAGLFAGLLKEIGTPAQRDVAARKLIGLVSAQRPGQKGALEALARLGIASARAYLLQLAARSPDARRIDALQALAFDPDEGSIGRLAVLAGGARVPLPVRGAAFQALEAIESPRTAEVIGRIIERDRSETVRYRAAEAIIACCKVPGAEKLLESLPPRYTYKKADVTDFIEKDIKGLGEKALPVLRRALSSKSGIARLIAVRVLGDLGTRADLPAMEKLVDDTTALRGWAHGATVGAEAKAAVRRLRDRI